jgi:hypothetical protein
MELTERKGSLKLCEARSGVGIHNVDTPPKWHAAAPDWVARIAGKQLTG